MEYIRRRENTLVNGHAHSGSSSVSERLKSIDSAMSWIRGELEEIKESDRTLMEIFKQLEGDVADLNSYVHSWRYSQYSNRDSFASGGRPVSASDLDLSILDSQSISGSNTSLECVGKEEAPKVGSLAPEVDSANGSSTYSPVLSQGQATSSSSSSMQHRLISSATTSNIAGSKRQTSASPQLKSSSSMTKISMPSPSLISRLQDETGSMNSRNSSESIDSGVQFENSSANGVEATNTATPVTTIAEKDESMGFGEFASDIFSTLGLRT